MLLLERCSLLKVQTKRKEKRIEGKEEGADQFADLRLQRRQLKIRSG